MACYDIYWSEGYDSGHAHASTLEGVVEWLRDNKSKYGWSLDNVTVHQDLGEIDVYDLFRRAEAGKSLAPPGAMQVEAELRALLRDARMERVGQETLDRVERIRTLLTDMMRGAVPGGLGSP